MTSFTYSTLKTAIYSFVEDDGDDVVSNIDIIIANGTEMLVRDLDLDIFNTTATGTLTVGVQTLSKPNDVLTIKSMRFTDTGDGNKVKRLLQRSQDFCEDYWPVPANTGLPKYYSDERDTQITIVPTPQTAYAYSMRYLSRPTALSDSNTANWISRNLGDLLLYACLVQAERFLMAAGIGRTGQWEELYMAQMVKARDEFDDIRRKDYRPVQQASRPETQAESRSE